MRVASAILEVKCVNKDIFGCVTRTNVRSAYNLLSKSVIPVNQCDDGCFWDTGSGCIDAIHSEEAHRHPRRRDWRGDRWDHIQRRDHEDRRSTELPSDCDTRKYLETGQLET